MKKSTFPYWYLAVFIPLFFYYSCQQDSTIEMLEQEEYLEKIETYEAKIKTLEEKLGQQKSTRGRNRPSNLINFEQAQRIYKAYDERADLISNIVVPDHDQTFEPTRSMFYDISELRKYLSYIDDLSQKVDVVPTGLRFYFALYPESYAFSDGSSRNARRQTIFIAPTLEQKVNNQIVQVGYTLTNEGKVKLLDKNNGFSHLRRNRSSKNLIEFSGKGSDDQLSLIANDLGATPPDYGE